MGVITTALKEEIEQARDSMAKAREEVTKAREEAAKARVKELEEDVALVSGQRDALNVQIRLVSAHVETLKNEITTLKGTVRDRDEALSGTVREIETLRAIVRDMDEALQAAEKARDKLRDEIVGWQTHAEGGFLPCSDLRSEFLYFLLTWSHDSELDKQQREAQATATAFQALLEAKVGRNQLL
jgi:predicted RNase H-like nuclease (RuvC/YqgF family)